MADKHFAILDDNNIVTDVILLNVDSEEEGIAQARNVKDNQSLTVVETFYDANDAATRYKYAGIGNIWDPENQAFYVPQPYPSWSLNSNFKWEAPIAFPTTNMVGEIQVSIPWDEDNQKWKGINMFNGQYEYDWNTDTLSWDSI